MRINWAAFVFLCFIALRSFGQTDSAFINSVTNNLKNYAAGHITEKAYLQFDKPYYAAGDTMYFKAYVVAGEEHKLSSLSGVLHVDLISPNNKINRFILLQLINGVAWGDFALADTLLEGNYRIRAYTQYMLPADYFDQQISIGSVKRHMGYENAVVAKNSNSADVQFFPEGGNLVTDIRSRVAFKIIGTDGMGADIKGIVTDNNNLFITSFQSGFAGMGSFTLLPEQGRAYKVRYKLKDSIWHSQNLPVPEDKGILLAVSTADPDNLKISVVSNPAYFKENHGKEVLVSVYAGGKFVYVPSKLDSYELDLQLPVSQFQSGVARVTLFDEAGNPLSERLVFIKNPAEDIPIFITPDKTIYDQREKVTVDIVNNNISPDRSGHYSVSVINENKLPGAAYPNSIYSYLLLTSEIKGYIENPDHYFNDYSDKTRAELNVLMLTQGYRKFSWKELAYGIPPTVKRVTERSISVRGYVNNLSDKKPVINGSVNLITPNGGPVLTTQTDSAGRFKFSGLIANDTTKLLLSATNTKGKDYTVIHLDKRPEEAPIEINEMPDNGMPDMQAYLQNRQSKQEADIKYDPKTKLLKEVKVNAYRSSNYGGAGHADQVIDLSKSNLGGTLEDVLAGRLHGITLYGGAAYLMTYHTAPMLIVVDGLQVDKDDTSPSPLITINPRDVATVEVLKYANTSIYGFNGGNGVIVITTKQGENAKFDTGPATGMLSFRPNGFYLARQFYSPKYLPGFASAKPDLRSTVYWLPETRTDEAGKGSFSYYNVDGSGTYRIAVEGVDSNGNIAHAIYKYNVK